MLAVLSLPLSQVFPAVQGDKVRLLRALGFPRRSGGDGRRDSWIHRSVEQQDPGFWQLKRVAQCLDVSPVLAAGG